VLVAAIAAWRLTGLMIERAQEFTKVAPFGGWQLYALVAAIGAACLAVLVTAVRLTRRQFRSVRGRTRYDRVAVMAAIVPGLLLGVGGASTVRPALNWASDHTRSAANERAIENKLAAEYRAGPPTVSFHGVSASDPRLARLLDPRELGPDWSARYEAGMIAGPLPTPGETSSVRAVLHEQHWSGNAWRTDMIVMEEIMTFRSAQDASRYLASCVDHREPASITTRVVAGVQVNLETVHRAGYAVYRHAEFAHGRYAVLLYPFANFTPTATTSRFPALLHGAVVRATP